MDSFVTRKRKHEPEVVQSTAEEESTEVKIALLSSLHPTTSQDALFECLLAHDGSVERASHALEHGKLLKSPRKSSAIGYQSSLNAFASQTGRVSKLLTKKGKTLELFSPEDVETHTPCSLIHNFLPSADADRLLKELLVESVHFRKERFQMFERSVESPHTYAFYVDSLEEVKQQKDAYVYNGGIIPVVHQSTPEMLLAAVSVKKAVNSEIQRRIEHFNKDKRKLKFQSPDEWQPNTSFINCYDGGKESVGFHSDQLTYLGPRAVIGSLSLGVSRQFRVRRTVPSDEAGAADMQGQIAIHLPHNSLLVMHAEMQEEWKHAITPTPTIDPHPVAGRKRINVTYRMYRDSLHPRFTPRCQCNVPCVLRCVQKQATTRGRYCWMCHSSYVPGNKGCSFFKWAEFDEDGRPPWAAGYQGNANFAVALDDVKQAKDEVVKQEDAKEI